MLAHWAVIEADLHEVYGIDTGSGILERRPAAWLRHRISGLLGRETALRALLKPDRKEPAI